MNGLAKTIRMKLYNTLTRKKEEFRPIKKGKASLYSCGPTVYWFAHIGNLRAYLFADVLRRTLEYSDVKTKFVMNITDVGHLTDDADAGEDKMLVAMRREGKSAYDIADFYTQAFYRDLERMNIAFPKKFVKATDHIKEQIKMIQQIEKNGFAYRTSDGIYFDTSKLHAYGRLSGQKAEEKKAGARVEMGEKKHPTDFALWKFSPSGRGRGKREMEWDSPWGVGFPGWHIECSAMSIKYLGVPFDIHTGGVDHIAVHHENELAQTEAAEGKLQANVWMHSEFLTVDGGKMSKSLGNLYTLDDLMKPRGAGSGSAGKGYDPLAFRYLVLGAHYRSKLNFTFEALDAAQNALTKLREAVRDWEKPNGECHTYEEKFFGLVNEDLDTAKALALVWQLVDDSAFSTAAKGKTLLKFDEVLGLGLKDYVAKPLQVPKTVMKLVLEREVARKTKQWAESDRLRDTIAAKGFVVEDTAHGPNVREKR